MLIFPKKKKDKNTNKNKEKYFLFWERARQGLTLLLRISIKGGESWLRSSLDKIVYRVNILFVTFLSLICYIW